LDFSNNFPNMDKKYYATYAAVEDRHWWFGGRRRIIERMIQQLNLPQDARILEAGCGTGGNLKMLARYGRLEAMEYEPIACEFANDRQVVAVRQGSLPEALANQGPFDLILLLDVLEHLEDDFAVLQALRACLKPGGYLLVTVPAYMFLWSHHDEINHHLRRYRLKPLRRLAKAAGMRIHYATYFNSWLFPAVALVRWLKTTLGIKDKPEAHSEMGIPNPLVNGFLAWLFATERFVVNRVSLPFGVSIMLVAQNQSP
jgi:2-polyprenyl-3-methyl-5-hydroxy-6-metoxy-1,4-benzoquinol methylase